MAVGISRSGIGLVSLGSELLIPGSTLQLWFGRISARRLSKALGVR